MKTTFKGFAVGNILRNKKLYAIVALIVVLICTLIFSLSFVTPKIANAIDTDARSTLVGKWSADSSPNNTPKIILISIARGGLQQPAREKAAT